jgi:hypothetical protein
VKAGRVVPGKLLQDGLDVGQRQIYIEKAGSVLKTKLFYL